MTSRRMRYYGCLDWLELLGVLAVAASLIFIATLVMTF